LGETITIAKPENGVINKNKTMNLKKLFRAFIILTFFGGLFLLYCHLESRWIKTKRFNLISKDIPQSLYPFGKLHFPILRKQVVDFFGGIV